MVYGVVCGSTDAVNYSHHHQSYPSSAELHQYYAHHYQNAYDQPPQPYSLPPPPTLTAAVEVHQQRAHQQPSIQDTTIIPPTYTSLDEYSGYAHHMAQSANQPYDCSQINPCPPGAYPGYLDPSGQYRTVSMGLYPHHDPVSMMGGGLPHQQPQQNVPTYKWMQVKRNVPKPGEKRVFCQFLYK